MTLPTPDLGINNYKNNTHYHGATDAMKGSKSYALLVDGTHFKASDAPGKVTYNYQIMHAETKFYFEYGIAPLCIFCAAVFSVFWGTLAGLLVKKVNMEDLTDV